MNENRSRPLRRSLGQRISLSYSAFLLYTLLIKLLIFSAVYALAACGNAGICCRNAAASYSGSAGQLLLERGVVSETEEADSRRMFSLMDGVPVMTVSADSPGGELQTVYVLTGEVQLFRALITALTALELLRIVLLIRRGERIGRRALKPITEIAEAARHLSATNLSERIEVHGARSELLELSVVLNDMLDRIESAYNTQKQFVSDASHELRTPIAVIQGYADMLDRWGKSDPEVVEESISAIRSEAQGMKELVEQLLFIARHDNRTHQYDMLYFDAAELADEAYRDTRLIAANHRVRRGEMNRAIVYGDRSALKQALRVFVDNAIKYTPEGGTITLSCRKEDKLCRITVADTGAGVAEAELGRIFERFYRADQARGGAVDGHGLGLSIARIIIRAHGGRIEVQSKKGVGSRFHILLPL